MGNFLDTPITDKETSVDEQPNGLAYGVSAMQGWRAQMEDDHVHELGLANVPSISLFGVYDGHGGDMVAHFAARHFKDYLLKHLDMAAAAAEEAGQQDDRYVARIKEAFEKALMDIDDTLGRLPEVASGQDQSGSTSVMTLVSQRHVICANSGDSRAVLSRDGGAVALSHDHKPYNPEEKERIEAAGGTVKFNRVNGDLAVSRALGDFVYKKCATVEAKQQAVTAFPEMICESRANGEFIVLACDGIWDVMSSQEVVDKVRDLILNGPPPKPDMSGGEDSTAEQAAEQDAIPPPKPRAWDLGAVCEALIDHCLQLGSRDNMSVVVVALQDKFKLNPEEPTAPA